MNITQVYLTPDYDSTEDRSYLRKYQNETSYIQLFIEECLRRNKVDFGPFNRLVFSEGGDPSVDFEVVGNNALPVALSKTYEELNDLKFERDIHAYYISKYIEGFTKFDSHFKSSLREYLEPLLAEKYENELSYDKQMAAKCIKNTRIQIVGRYTRSVYQLIAKCFLGGELYKSTVIYECAPDIFIVKHRVHKVHVKDGRITVINKLQETTVDFGVDEII